MIVAAAAMSAADTRITKELSEVCKDDGTSGVTASVAVGDRGGSATRHLIGKIKGPQGTPYEGGIFEIDIRIPKQYPFEPPKMKFNTKIWHPNISSQTGAICLVRIVDRRLNCRFQQALPLSSLTFQTPFSFLRTSSKISGRQRLPSKLLFCLYRHYCAHQSPETLKMRRLLRCTMGTNRISTEPQSFGPKLMRKKLARMMLLPGFAKWALTERVREKLSINIHGTRVRQLIPY